MRCLKGFCRWFPVRVGKINLRSWSVGFGKADSSPLKRFGMTWLSDLLLVLNVRTAQREITFHATTATNAMSPTKYP